MSPVAASREPVQERLDELHARIMEEHLDGGRVHDPATGCHPAGTDRDGFGIRVAGARGEVLGTGDQESRRCRGSGSATSSA